MKKYFVMLLVSVLSIGCLCSCTHEDEYRKTLESGYEKYQNGEDMSKEEYEAVKSFNDWKEDNSEQSYDDWDN